MKYTNEEEMILEFKKDINTFLEQMITEIKNEKNIEDLLLDLKDVKTDIEYFIEEVEFYMEENQEREE